ncbi:DNA endonuclease [Rossellomorea sp. YZS02]|uniref:DNA endonuclease n=1 Tax=Rossellomorea sp. YZS02 TaxID=3097358 RepID=UPI002A0BCF70|nr:DNA endonuclease [Rossellomorea sp. YZS02]MDX8343218.1 DNA endonuclease [Rossellomorea sp. YZS02]
MEKFLNLSSIQRNLLVGSIMGDGEITKIYPNSRRKNHSYREHYGVEQENYRIWKASFFPELFYLTKKSQTMRSKSDPLFTELFPYFYTNHSKQIPIKLLKYCTSPYFLTALYLDDGSLSISKNINHRKKKIYLTPQIFLYLQNYTKEELEVLQQHILESFQIDFKLNKRRDGHGYILRGTSTDLTYNFLNLLSPITLTCESMYYKSNWEWRLKQEEQKFLVQYPNYQIIASSSSRNKNYSDKEINEMISLKKKGFKDQEIANTLARSYWSVVYKLRELRNGGVL